MSICKHLKVFVLPVALCCRGDKYVTNNDWKEDNLKGRVKSIKITAYLAFEKFGNIQKGDREIKNVFGPDYSIEYDSDGKKMLEVRYDSDGARTTCKYEYTDNDGPYKKRFFDVTISHKNLINLASL